MCVPSAVSAADETPADSYDYGDINLDHSVDVSDVVLICRFAAEDSDVRINAQGRLNGDVNGSGGLDKEDGIKILRYIAQYITKDELAPKS